VGFLAGFARLALNGRASALTYGRRPTEFVLDGHAAKVPLIHQRVNRTSSSTSRPSLQRSTCG
jgi:hypothetical protein